MCRIIYIGRFSLKMWHLLTNKFTCWHGGWKHYKYKCVDFCAVVPLLNVVFLVAACIQRKMYEDLLCVLKPRNELWCKMCLCKIRGNLSPQKNSCDKRWDEIFQTISLVSAIPFLLLFQRSSVRFSSVPKKRIVRSIIF